MELIVDGKKRRVAHSGAVSSLLAKLGLRREEVVVKINGRLAPETRALRPGDRVEVIKVVFGG